MIPSMNKKQFIALFVLFFSIQGAMYAQIDTIINRDYGTRDTVYIIEEHTIVEKQLKIVRDTLVDTIYKTRTVEKPVKPKHKYDSKSVNLYTGVYSGVSFDTYKLQYWSVYDDYYNELKGSETSKLDFHTGLFLHANYRKFYAEVELGYNQHSSNFDFGDNIEEVEINYLVTQLKGGYFWWDKEKIKVGSGLGFGYNHLLNSKGQIIDPDNIEETGSIDDFLPLQNTLGFVSLHLLTRFPISKHFSIDGELFGNRVFNSITPTTHPIVFWKRDLGVKVKLAYLF